MCGRFTLTLDADEIRTALRLGQIPAEWQPRRNIAPTEAVAVVVDAATRAVAWMRWGLVPSWAKDISIGSRMFNARAETLAEKPSFRAALQQRRCLILADGFYEWQKPASGRGKSQPFYFRLQDNGPFMFAGLWESWRQGDGETLRSCTLITCAANATVAPIHERMPVILLGDAPWQWLAAPAQSLLAPLPAEALTVEKVSGMPT
ncbi:MAG TPA: SOS response-associated peptidase [Anaerolineaceae bacterium]|jgi:putative SOS response-associated peptidase YedK|nr:SOS response-associated peptidase [Anaerolineaceae bacterium]